MYLTFKDKLHETTFNIDVSYTQIKLKIDNLINMFQKRYQIIVKRLRQEI